MVVAIEVGLLLLTLPWTAVWTRDFAGGAAGRAILFSPYVRGAVSGLGILNLWAATNEITPFPH